MSETTPPGGRRRMRPAILVLVKPKVPGVTGVLASLAGKQPPSVRFWLAQGPAPVFVRFEGPLYVDGPTWRMRQMVPSWPR